MIETQLTENCGLKVVWGHDIHGGPVADFVSLAIRHTWLETAPRKPDRESLTVVVAAISVGKVPLADRQASNLATPMDDRRIEHASLFQVGDKCRGRLIRTQTNRGEVLADICMSIPRLATEKHLHKPNTPFDQSPSDQATGPVLTRMRLIEAV